MEKIDIIFSSCALTKFVWITILAKLELGSQNINWEIEVQQMIRWFKGRSFSSRMGKVTFNVVVYMLWQERNVRFFFVINVA